MNTLALDHVNKRAEFVMSFTIPFKAVEDPTSQAKCYSPHEVVMAWREVCIKALRMRIDACMEMLFRNKDRVIGSDERGVLFKKKNGNIHHFSHASCFAMEAFIEILEEAESAGGHNFRCSSNTATDKGFVLDSRRTEERSSGNRFRRTN